MALNSVSTVSSTPNSINQQDFLKILLTQLNSQNPLKPMDNTTFVTQLAQFSQLQQTQELSAAVKQLLAVQTATETMSLLGRTVGVLNGSSIASGSVTNISLYGNDPLLTIHPTSGSDLTGVALNQVLSIR